MSYVNRKFSWDLDKLREFFQTHVKGAIASAIKTDGSAYDVSEHFPTSGPNSDGKFTLEYILSNANTLIPEAWRKGGMSIRFVQSNDNKYIQARLMADSFSTDVTQWQVVDDEPTQGSDNLVSSGGVAVFVKKDIGNLIYGKAIGTDGNEINNVDGFLISEKIAVKPLDVVSWKQGGSEDYCLAAYRSDGTIVNYWRGSISVRDITIPNYTSYIKATFKDGTDYSLVLDKGTQDERSVVYKGVNEKIHVLEKEVAEIEDELDSVVSQTIELSSEMEIIRGNIINGKYVDDNGEEQDNADWCITKPIAVSGGETVSYRSGSEGTPDVKCICEYDENDNCIDYYRSGGEEGRTFTLRNNCKYIVASFLIESYYPWELKVNNVDKIDTGIIGIIDELSKDLSYCTDAINGNLLYNKAVEAGNNYEVVDAVGYIATLKIPVTSTDSIKYLAGEAMGNPAYGLVEYRSNGVVNTSYQGTAHERTITPRSTTSYILATFKFGTGYYLKINDNDVIIDRIDGRVSALEKSVGIIKKDLADEEYITSRSRLMPFNMFGDILPPLFKSKLLAMDTDLLITCQGDSLTGLIERCIAQDVPEHCPPGQQYRSWLYFLQYYVSKVKPVCDRLDSQRDNADVFTKTGTWENVITAGRTEIYDSDGTNYGQQRSVSALTFCSSDNNAAVSFEFDADAYEKCNIVFSKEPDGVLTKIVIEEGDGNMLVSEDRTTWVEANGFTCNQRTPIATYNSASDAINGNANRQAQRRLWMKKANGVTGTLHISYQRDNSTAYSDSYMYMWGIEKWNGVAIFVDNLGRGGRDTNKLKANISDIFDRNPDLAIYEMPLANEVGKSAGGIDRATLKGTNYYGSYFLGSNGDSFKQRSNDYTTLPLIVIMPHGRSKYFNDDNDAIPWVSAPAGEPDAYSCYKQMFGWLKQQLSSYTNVKFINLYDQLINEALVLNDEITKGFYESSTNSKQITADGVHLNNYGARMWLKYLAGIFQV